MPTQAPLRVLPTDESALNTYLACAIRRGSSQAVGYRPSPLVHLHVVVFQIQKPDLGLFRQRLDDLDGVS